MSNRKLVFDNHGLAVFSKFNTDSEGLKNLMIDMALHRDIFDDEGNKISKADAEHKLREMNLSFFGLEPGFSTREFNRANATYGRQWFQILEEVEDFYIDYGIRENEIFNQLVNYRSRAHGEDNLFYIDAKDILLSVNKVGTSHHDYSLQRLNRGSSYSVQVARYGAAVGIELNRYLAGQETWDKLVETLGRSFVIAQQNEILAQIMSAATKLPVKNGFVASGALNANSKAPFDAIGANVSMANFNSPVAIFGTQIALKQITNLKDVDWVDDGTKKIVSNTGRLGQYENMFLVEVPNRFADETLTSTIFDDTKLLFFATGPDYKLVDMYTEGETEIVEADSKDAAIQIGRRDDVGKYEMQMTWGTDVRIRHMFGQWTLTSAQNPTLGQ